MQLDALRWDVVTKSGLRIFVRTALLDFLTEVAYQHITATDASPNGAGDGGGGEPREPRPISVENGRLSFRHQSGSFGVFLSAIGGAVALREGALVARRIDGAAGPNAALAAVLAAAAHAAAHVPLKAKDETFLGILAGPSYRRLFALSVGGAVAGSCLGARKGHRPRQIGARRR